MADAIGAISRGAAQHGLTMVIEFTPIRRFPTSARRRPSLRPVANPIAPSC